MIIKLYIGNDYLDRFKDEGIELTSSISNINDITKNTTDYTKSFTVPATNQNNKVFKHYYNANIDNTFDARVKQNGRIELDGAPFKYGKWRLERVQVKQGRPYAYTVTFWGNLVNLKDKLKNDELSSLDLSAFDHELSSVNVKAGLQTGLFGGDVVYNLFSKKQLYYNSASDNTQTETLANIAFDGGVNTGVIYNNLRPSIRLIKLIEAIEIKYGIVFSRDFFGRTEFNNLFLWTNNESSVLPQMEKSVQIALDDQANIDTDYIVVDTVNYIWNVKEDCKVSQDINPEVGYESVPYTVSLYKGSTLESSYSNTGVGLAVWYLDKNNEYTVRLSSSQQIYFHTRPKVRDLATFYRGEALTPIQNVSGTFSLSLYMPKLKIIDFLSGLFKAFKLVVIADEFDDVYVNSLNSFYAEGRVWNISKHVKTESLDVSRGALLNEINFKFQEPTTLLNLQFKKNTGIAYGDESILLTEDGTPDGTPLDGDSLDYELPFEQFVYERLYDLNDGVLTNIMYAGIFDENIEPVNPKAHIFYNVNVPVLGKPIGFLDEVGVKSVINTTINTMSHSIDFEVPQYNFSFGIENNEWLIPSNGNTLYYNYHKDYIEAIFNIKRRTFKYEAILPLRILLQLKLNDVLEIKNNYYRIDNYTLNLISGNISLSLINSFDNTIAGFNSNVYAIYADYQAQEQSIYVTNLGNFSLNISSGTWLTWYDVGNNIFFVFAENNTGQTRLTDVTITNTDTLQVIDIFVQQKPRIVTSDNNIITSDNDIITSDNG